VGAGDDVDSTSASRGYVRHRCDGQAGGSWRCSAGGHCIRGAERSRRFAGMGTGRRRALHRIVAADSICSPSRRRGGVGLAGGIQRDCGAESRPWPTSALPLFWAAVVGRPGRTPTARTISHAVNYIDWSITLCGECGRGLGNTAFPVGVQDNIVEAGTLNTPATFSSASNTIARTRCRPSGHPNETRRPPSLKPVTVGSFTNSSSRSCHQGTGAPSL